MNGLPAGYYDTSDDDDELSECESGFSEQSAEGHESAPLPGVSLQKAIYRGALDEVELLVTELAEYEGLVLENGLKPLVYAANIGDSQIVELLLRVDDERGVASAEAYASYTPLMAACSGFGEDFDDSAHEQRLECVRLLLAAGHDAAFRDRYGETALMRACKVAPVSVIETLLQQPGVKLNDADNDGWTPLFFATNRGDLSLVQHLLALGADPERTDKRNRSAYMIALEKGFTELADLLMPEVDRQTMEFVVPAAGSSIFEEEDTLYRREVLEMVASTSATMQRNVPILAEQKLELRDFLLLRSEQELKTLGVLFSGHRKKLLARIKQFHLGCWLPESFGLTATKTECGQLMALLSFVATLHRQLYVLQASLEYVREDAVKLTDEARATAAQMLRTSKCELLRLNERLADLERRLVTINEESRPYLTAEEIVD